MDASGLLQVVEAIEYRSSETTMEKDDGEGWKLNSSERFLNGQGLGKVVTPYILDITFTLMVAGL